jgi:hypothetical protein
MGQMTNVFGGEQRIGKSFQKDHRGQSGVIRFKTALNYFAYLANGGETNEMASKVVVAVAASTFAGNGVAVQGD